MGARWKKSRKKRLKKWAVERQANAKKLAEQVSITDASTTIKVESGTTEL